MTYLGLRTWLGPVRHSPLVPVLSNAERDDEKTKRVANWIAQPTVALLSADLAVGVNELFANNCSAQVPPKAKLVPLDNLSAKQKLDLTSAIIGFLQAYAKNDPAAVFDYMDGRQEVLHEKDLAQLRNTLVNRYGYSRAAMDGADAKSVFGLVWKDVMKARPDWQTMALHCGCILTWKSSEPRSKAIEYTLGDDENVIFANIVRFRHFFSPHFDSIESTLARDGAVLMADAKMIIRYDEERLNKPVPHYLRFWYDPVKEIWHPHDLALIYPYAAEEYPSLAF